MEYKPTPQSPQGMTRANNNHHNNNNNDNCCNESSPVVIYGDKLPTLSQLEPLYPQYQVLDNNNICCDNDHHLGVGGYQQQQQQQQYSNQQQLQQQMMETSIIILPIKNDNRFRVARFKVTPSEAIATYDKWKENLWFTPTGFKKQLSTDTLEKIYVPFYSFNCTYRVDFGGIVHYCPATTNQHFDGALTTKNEHVINNKDHHNHSNQNNGGSNSNGNNGGTSNGQQSEKCTGYIVRSSNNILLYAMANTATHSISINDEFNFNVQIMFDFHKCRDVFTMEAFQRDCEQEHSSICANMQPEEVWRPHRSRIEVEQQRIAPEYLRTQEQCEVINNTTWSKVDFLEVRAMLYYIPYYYTRFEFNNQTYSFLINGQSGQVSCQRPQYGLGKIGDFYKGIKNYFGSVMGYQEPESRIQGCDLALEDNTKVYNIDHTYLTWPRSGTGFMGSSTSLGWVTIKNQSSQHVTIRAQKRRSVEKGNIITLNPQQEITYSYKGHWCIELIDNLMVKITSFSIVGGSGYPNINNKLTSTSL